MLDLIGLLGILLGALGVLLGLVLIAPEVRIHQITVTSRGSWVYRGGAMLTLIGLAGLILGDGAGEIASVGLITGITGVLGGLFMWNHERAQALHAGADRWDWPRALTPQIMGLGALIVLVALLAR
jgi:hypothetical protein